MAAAGTIRVLIADDHRLFAEALEAIIGAEPDIEVVGRAADGAEAVDAATELAPDLVLMDISMPVLDGFHATERILRRRPRIRVVFLTGSAADEDMARARTAGAVGYVTKDRIAAELVDAIRHAVGDSRRLS
jgi:DNA-binding NarL/FixJ family response regulator